MEPLYRRILGLFHSETVKWVAQLNEAMVRDDRREVHRIGHAIKGAAGNVCALSLAQSAREVESAALAGSVEVLRAHIAALEEDWRRLDEAIMGGGPCHGG